MYSIYILLNYTMIKIFIPYFLLTLFSFCVKAAPSKHNEAQALSSNSTNPPTDLYDLTAQGNKYSILSWADNIKRSASGFNYRFEAQTLGRYGATFTANAAYSFVSTSNGNTNITLNEKFDTWSYADSGIEARMPWYSSTGHGLLTTSTNSSSMWWGSLISSNAHCGGATAPYMENVMSCPTKIWYWVR